MFEGFEFPKENWSKLPHALIDALHRFSSLAELKVVLYILRHTWGFQEFEELKRITLDEFQHGRRRKDRSRMDGGAGMSKNAIREGIKRALANGFIIQEPSRRKRPGRPANAYQLREYGSEVDPLDRNKGQKLILQGAKVDPSSEKDTLERYPNKKDTYSADADSTSIETDPDLPIPTKKSPGYCPGPGKVVSCEDPDTGEEVGEPSWRIPQGQVANQAFAITGRTRLRYGSKTEFNKVQRIERMLENGEMPYKWWENRVYNAGQHRWSFSKLLEYTLNTDKQREWEASQVEGAAFQGRDHQMGGQER